MAFSGKNGTLKVNGVEVPGIINWAFSPRSNNPSWNDNTTGGTKRRVPGVKDGSGTFTMNCPDTGNTPIEEGDIVDLELHVDATGDNYIDGSFIIDGVDPNDDINDGAIVQLSVSFSCNGPWTKNGVLAKA